MNTMKEAFVKAGIVSDDERQLKFPFMKEKKKSASEIVSKFKEYKSKVPLSHVVAARKAAKKDGV